MSFTDDYGNRICACTVLNFGLVCLGAYGCVEHDCRWTELVCAVRQDV